MTTVVSNLTEQDIRYLDALLLRDGLVRLGPGILRIGLVEAWDSSVTTSVGLEPEDDRPTLWLDPRALYRLHDQTVDLFVTDGGDEPWRPEAQAPE